MKHGHFSDTDTNDYTKLCHFPNLLSVSRCQCLCCVPCQCPCFIAHIYIFIN
jgi:hypothetical protein